MTIWLTIIGMALVTALVRVAPLLALRGDLAPWLRRWLAYVPPAVFAALIVPPLLLRDVGGARVIALGPALPAGLVGALVAWRTSNVLLTIVAGLAAFWAARWLGMQ